MFLIAHRGNINGPCSESENKPEYIFGGLRAYDDIHFEIDVWRLKGNLFLGHDEPQYMIGEDFLIQPRIWCHAKNIDAFEFMLNCPLIHCFYHQTDNYTLTSRGYIWTYPGKPLCEKSICVLPEQSGQEPDVSAGVCSDFINRYR